MMNWQLPDSERTYLRELARRQAGFAALPVMEQRRRLWFDLNDGRAGARPPVIVDAWTFERELLPESVFHCRTETGRTIERQLLFSIRNHECIDDDKVISNTFDIDWFVEINEFGVPIGLEIAGDAGGPKTGYRFLHPIKDLKEDFHLLKPAACRVDREKTLAWKAFLSDLLGEFLPVEIRTGAYGYAMLTHRVIQLMGMEAFFLAMVECPDEVHRLMGFLRDNVLRIMRWAEAEGLLRVNNGNQASFGASYNFTTRLPAPGLRGEAARLCDMWGCANSQETVGVSPAMYHEFCAPYYQEATRLYGLTYYGCCEAVHPVWDDVRRIPHLKKVSISRWCDQRFMGEALRGTDIVFSRKPDPKFLGLDATLDEEAWAAHIRETLEATAGVFVEFIIRDVYTVHGDLDKCRRAVAIARREIEKRCTG